MWMYTATKTSKQASKQTNKHRSLVFMILECRIILPWGYPRPTNSRTWMLIGGPSQKWTDHYFTVSGWGIPPKFYLNFEGGSCDNIFLSLYTHTWYIKKNNKSLCPVCATAKPPRWSELYTKKLWNWFGLPSLFLKNLCRLDWWVDRISTPSCCLRGFIGHYCWWKESCTNW